MAGKRKERLNEQFKREVAEILKFEVKDPRVGSVIVTDAKVTQDLSNAQMFVMIPDGNDEGEVMAGLQAAASFMRSQLAQRLKLRKMPALRFTRDSSLQYATRIEQLLAEVRPVGEPSVEDEPAGPDEH